MNLADKIVWITGSARRLGRAMALDLARRGANIVVHYSTSRHEAEVLAREIEAMGRRTLIVQGDQTRVPDIVRIVGEIDAAFGRLDVLINSASNFKRTPIESVTEADWHDSIDVNLKGPTFCALEAAKLIKRGGGGKIINMADWAALRPYRNYLPYLIAKAGVVQLTKILALELAPEIQVNAIGPGPVLLPDGMAPEEMQSILQHVPLGRFGSPQDIVATAAFLLEGSDYITGQVICVDGGRFIANPG
ncbi:SDR family oxidoreductase [bacterium]|nr:SDR family oxidoreductase [bacterium]